MAGCTGSNSTIARAELTEFNDLERVAEEEPREAEHTKEDSDNQRCESFRAGASSSN